MLLGLKVAIFSTFNLNLIILLVNSKTIHKRRVQGQKEVSEKNGIKKVGDFAK